VPPRRRWPAAIHLQDADVFVAAAARGDLAGADVHDRAVVGGADLEQARWASSASTHAWGSAVSMPTVVLAMASSCLPHAHSSAASTSDTPSERR
jgi:hypothetical protein